MITETRINGIVRLSDHQKQVMAKVIKAETPQSAAADISHGAKVIAARDQLVNDGYLQFSEQNGGFAEVTKSGLKISANNGISDEVGIITQEGDQIAAIQNESLINEINFKL